MVATLGVVGLGLGLLVGVLFGSLRLK